LYQGIASAVPITRDRELRLQALGTRRWMRCCGEQRLKAQCPGCIDGTAEADALIRNSFTAHES